MKESWLVCSFKPRRLNCFRFLLSGRIEPKEAAFVWPIIRRRSTSSFWAATMFTLWSVKPLFAWDAFVCEAFDKIFVCKAFVCVWCFCLWSGWEVFWFVLWKYLWGTWICIILFVKHFWRIHEGMICAVFVKCLFAKPLFVLRSFVLHFLSICL